MIYIGKANDLQYPIDKNQDVSEEKEKIKNTPHHNHMPISKSNTNTIIQEHMYPIYSYVAKW